MSRAMLSISRLNLWLGGAAALALAVVVILGANPFAQDPFTVDLALRLGKPSMQHWFGTDEFGRDILARTAHGALISSGIALSTVLLATAVGGAIGVVAGFLRGWADRAWMILIDALLAFPGILLALALVAVFGASRWGIIGALTLAYIPIVARVVRGATLSLREKEFIEAARVSGDGAVTIMLRHVVPNLAGPVLVLMTSMFGWVLLSESALSFLGVGISPPAPTWGNMLAAARPHLDVAPHLAIVPGLCITAAVLAVNLLGDALRDYLDPRSRL